MLVLTRRRNEAIRIGTTITVRVIEITKYTVRLGNEPQAGTKEGGPPMSRRKSESFVLPGNVTVTVLEIQPDRVRLGVEAPSEVPIHRQEVYAALHGQEVHAALRQRENVQAKVRVVPLRAAIKDGRAFLNDGQYVHLRDIVRRLGEWNNREEMNDLRIAPIQGLWELKEKGGILGRINARIFFAYLKDRRQIVVFGALKRRERGSDAQTYRHQDAEPPAGLSRRPRPLAPTTGRSEATHFGRKDMNTSSNNEKPQAEADNLSREKRHANRLSKYPRTRLEDIKEIVSLLVDAQGEEERVEISKTLLEVLFPKSIGGIGAFDDEIEAEARERVDTYRRKVGQAIRQRREAVGMTQERLAELAGIPQSHVSRLECGKHTRTHLTIKRVADALKTSPSQLDPGFEDEEDDGTGANEDGKNGVNTGQNADAR